MFGNPETTPGGLALKFYTSLRLDMRKIEALKEGEVVIGSRHRVRVVKNKIAPPFRTAEFDILNNSGISKSSDLLSTAVDLGLVEKTGAFFKYGKQLLGQGAQAARLYLEENPKLTKQLETEIWKKIKKE
ncbi:DNA recombination/repair protein RecA, partial [Candidatus Shapirobacteria bacterium]|nr:DNA recombination/repair protein RecA [Candidatus Shapirobacteria bacterium]